MIVGFMGKLYMYNHLSTLQRLRMLTVSCINLYSMVVLRDDCIFIYLQRIVGFMCKLYMYNLLSTLQRLRML